MIDYPDRLLLATHISRGKFVEEIRGRREGGPLSHSLLSFLSLALFYPPAIQSAVVSRQTGLQSEIRENDMFLF